MATDINNLPVPPTYTRILLQEHPGHRLALLKGTSLRPGDFEQERPITVAQQLRIFENAIALGGAPDWGLSYGARLGLTSHGPLGFAALTAPTIGAGFDVFARFASSRAPQIHYRGERRGSVYRVHAEPKIALGLVEQPLMELLLLILEGYLRAALGYPPGGSRVLFSHPAPAYADRFPQYFTLPCEFGADATCLEVPIALCATPCPLHDEKTHQAALARCRHAMAAIIDPTDAASRVRNLLAAEFARIEVEDHTARVPDLAAVASTLHVSTRTLTRQLAAQGTSYRAILDEFKLDAACRLLAQARFSVAEIGALLGYEDAANFGRAFRRWTGMAPGRFRRRGGSDAGGTRDPGVQLRGAV